MDNNMNIRKYFKKANEQVEDAYRRLFPNRDLKEKMLIYVTELFSIINIPTKYSLFQRLVTIENQHSEEDYRAYLFTIELIKMVVIQDLYMFLNEKALLKTITTSEKAIFDLLKGCIAKGNYNSLMNDTKTIEDVIAPLFEMLNASALRKVELFKSLSDEDIKLLTSINLFFKEEYDHYNITITKEFLIKHIKIWEKKEDYETAITKVTNFLIRIFSTNIAEGMKMVYTISDDSDEQEKLLCSLNNHEFDNIALILRKIYDNSKSEINQLN